MKLPYTIGFEMTGLVPNYMEKRFKRWGCYEYTTTEETDAMTSAVSTLIAYKLIERYPKDFKIQKYIDGHCLEFQSPVFKTTEAMDEFYLFVKSQFRKYGVTPKNPITVCGGNHIHFGIKNRWLIRNIFRDFTSRYYIPWVFTQPDDTDSCNNMITLPIQNTPSIYDTGLNINLHRILYGEEDDFKFDAIDGEKDYALVTNRPKGETRTLEFRCVESPLNFTEFKEQRDFFIAYVNYIATFENTLPVKHMTHVELNKVKPEECVAKFNALLETLNLNPRKYKKYIERNLYPRWEMKRVRV